MTGPRAGRCKVAGCGWTVHDATSDLVSCHFVWHLYEQHRMIWNSIIGPRKPVEPDPRTQKGRKAIRAREGIPGMQIIKDLNGLG